MGQQVHKNGSYTIGEGSPVFLEGQGISYISLLLQGKLDVYLSSLAQTPGCGVTMDGLKHNSYRLFDLSQNIFIGANDLYIGGMSSLTFTATSDCALYAYPAATWQDARGIIESNKDYGAYIVNSICSLIVNSYHALENVQSNYFTSNSIFNNLCAYYIAITEEYELNRVLGHISQSGTVFLSQLRESELFVPIQFSKQFIESSKTTLSDHTEPVNSKASDEIKYYNHLSSISPDILKAFFSADSYIAIRQVGDAAAYLDTLIEELRNVFKCYENTIRLLYSADADTSNAYTAFIQAAFEMREKGLDYSPALDAATFILNSLKEICLYFDREYKHDVGIDFEYLEHIHSDSMAALEAPMTSIKGASIDGEAGIVQTLPEELKNSAVKILEYSRLSEEKVTCFLMNLTAFRNLKDKLSTEESARLMRKAIAKSFFEIYTAVFNRAHTHNDDSRLIRMFLSFGYMDERLLDTNQVMALYRLAGMEHSSGEPKVYLMHEWLAAIYEMEKDPSVNNFGSDYIDTFRELKKQGRLTEKDKHAYLNNKDDRLSFEIDNMLTTNHKLCHGQISTYFPILHRDCAPSDPIRSFVSPALIREKLSNIMAIDFSLFHREIHYRNPKTAIEKEIIMAQTLPDILLVPIYGTRAMMWQEISGRVRNTPGRFLLPVFSDENIDDVLIKLAGNFRWELCRTMMGAAWNDISQNSLTSEYADYIQFYRKNRDLTDEAKEKVKSLVSKYRNRLRDIFTSEYEIWINNESKGNPRLNKVARNIFIKHCPFSREIRERLVRQPIYADQINIFNTQRGKKVRELENRYKSYIKANGSLDSALEENLHFYKDL
jgi:CRP-like cAMP-binding protein